MRALLLVAMFGCRSETKTERVAEATEQTAPQNREPDPWSSKPSPPLNDDPAKSMGGGGTARFDLRARTGWTLVSSQSGVIVLANQSGGILEGFPFKKRPSEAQIQKLLTGARIETSGDVRAIEANTALGPNRGWVRTLACDNEFLVLVYVEKGAGTSTNRETLKRATCLSKTAPDIAWPRA